MDTALPQKFPFILDRNLAKANCTGNHVCTSCDTVVLGVGMIDKPGGADVFSSVGIFPLRGGGLFFRGCGRG